MATSTTVLLDSTLRATNVMYKKECKSDIMNAVGPGKFAGTPAGPYPSYPLQQNPPAQVQTQTSLGSSTIRPEHVHASLLSAVEDKMRRRMGDKLGTAHAELQSVRKMNEDLTNGQRKLNGILNALSREQSELDDTVKNLERKLEEVTSVINSAPSDDEMNIDESINCSTAVHKQLLNAFAEDAAIEDAIYYLGQALKRGNLDLDAYLKLVRKYSRAQFMARATMQKCRQKAGLPV